MTGGCRETASSSKDALAVDRMETLILVVVLVLVCSFDASLTLKL